MCGDDGSVNERGHLNGFLNFGSPWCVCRDRKILDGTFRSRVGGEIVCRLGGGG